jgi:hypothetical protein
VVAEQRCGAQPRCCGGRSLGGDYGRERDDDEEAQHW